LADPGNKNSVNAWKLLMPQQMSDRPPIRVVLVDDHIQIHRIVHVILGATTDIKLVGQGANGQEGIAQCEQYQPDIALMDVVMPVMDGIEATKVVHERFPAIKILVLSSFQDHESVYAMLRNGAVGYITKGSLAIDLAETIRATFQGKMVFSSEVGAHLMSPPQPAVNFHLTDRELEVLVLLAEGYPSASPRSSSTWEIFLRNWVFKLVLRRWFWRLKTT
jgi:NarL family two-component system response regulator LiaR